MSGYIEFVADIRVMDRIGLYGQKNEIFSKANKRFNIDISYIFDICRTFVIRSEEFKQDCCYAGC